MLVNAAANTGALALMDNLESTKELSTGTKTFAASIAAAGFRCISTPIDTCKTIMQVEGKGGLTKLKGKFRQAGGFPRGVPVLWYGAMGSATATFVGHYPCLPRTTFCRSVPSYSGMHRGIWSAILHEGGWRGRVGCGWALTRWTM